MTTYARNINGMAVDVTAADPAELFHHDLAKQFVEVPDYVKNGATYSDGKWTNAIVTEVPLDGQPIATKKVTPVEFKLLFTGTERVAIKKSTDPLVQDFFELVENQRIVNAADANRGTIDLGLQSTQEALGYLELKGLIGAGRAVQIMMGTGN